jgi:glycosyltransferase involved in cell wall biosynthesis
MKILVISHTPHYTRESAVVGWGPTVRELDHLAQVFERVVHVAPLHAETAPESAIAYESDRVTFVPVTPVGGERLRDKVSIIANAPRYCRVILREIRGSDVVHVRCPASISLVAVLLLGLVRGPTRRWVKYAGNWSPARGEAWSYRLQRWCLRKRFHGAQVTVNGSWPAQPPHVHPFLNPCLTEDELAEGARVGAKRTMSTPVRLLFVGRLERAKGIERAMLVLERLGDHGVDATLDIVGDGPQRSAFARFVAERGLDRSVSFHGWLPRRDIDRRYADAHILLLPSSCSEGWPKVLSEGMAYGVVPVASNVSSVPEYLERAGTGSVVSVDDVDGYASAIRRYVADGDAWKAESERAMSAARQFSYQNYLAAVRCLLSLEH